MEPLSPAERTEALSPLLPPEPEPGTQAGFHLVAQPRIGQAWVAPDGRCGLVVQDRSAWVFGEPRSLIGEHLAAIGFYGTLTGAISSLDPTGAVPSHVRHEPHQRTIFVSDGSVTFETDEPIGTPVRPEDAEALARCDGAWVLELWEEPSAAPFSAIITDEEGAVIGVGGPRTLSRSYAELAVWLAPEIASRGMVAAHTQLFVPPIIESGRLLTAVVRLDNVRARGLMRKVGWEAVGQETTVVVGDMRAARSARRFGG